jgi:hypothetical protein
VVDFMLSGPWVRVNPGCVPNYSRHAAAMLYPD